MTDQREHAIAIKSLRILGNTAYFACLVIILCFLIIGFFAKYHFNSPLQTHYAHYGISIYKFPLVNRYMVATERSSPLRAQRFNNGRLYSINNCDVAAFNALTALYRCSDRNLAERLSITVDFKGEPTQFELSSREQAIPISYNYLYFGIDTLLLVTALVLSLLLFFKARHYLSGFLLSFSLMLTVCESQYFYIGSNIISAATVESIRLHMAFIFAPLAMYFFPQAFNKNFWRSKAFVMIALSILAMSVSYQFLTDSLYAFTIAVSFSLLVIIIHFVMKYRAVLNTRERKQVLSLTLCVAIGLLLYFPLLNFGGQYGFLIGRYIIMLSVGIGVFVALMRYGLWQVDTLISKSATLSLLSIVAFSVWAGLDQGMQALLNQTLGFSNKTFTAFLAAAISTAIAVPAYNFISKSCDSFFNKDLHLLKRLLSKDILVLAETQKLHVFVKQLSSRLVKLSGAFELKLAFSDTQRLAAPIEHTVKNDIEVDESPIIRKEIFDYEIENILSVTLELSFADRRINKEIKHELEEGTDEIARALASCSRWNYLEQTGTKKPTFAGLTT